MKKQSLILSTVMALALFSCQEESASDSGSTDATSSVGNLDLISEEAVAVGFDEVDILSEDALEVLEKELNANFKSAKRGSKGQRPSSRLGCATVDNDTVNNIVTIDFGTGCEDPRGRIRSGKIIVEYSGERNELGSTKTITLEDFAIDTLLFEGVKRTEVTAVDDLSITIESTLTGGLVTFPDATFSTRNSVFYKSRFTGETEEENYKTLSGSSTDQKRDGTTYSVTIIDELVSTRSCQYEQVGIPVSGTKEIVNGSSTAFLDFGDGTCDNNVDVTIDGVTETLTIEPEKRKGSHKGRK